jgi:hypothetical protein
MKCPLDFVFSESTTIGCFLPATTEQIRMKHHQLYLTVIVPVIYQLLMKTFTKNYVIQTGSHPVEDKEVVVELIPEKKRKEEEGINLQTYRLENPKFVK